MSTPCMNLFESPAKGEEEAMQASPRTQTLDFISQFARTYHVEPAIYSELSGFLLN